MYDVLFILSVFLKYFSNSITKVQIVLITLKNINWKLYLVLIFTGLLPTLYTTLRIFFLNDLPDSYSMSIAAQIQWLGIMYEVIQEALILPMFFLLGQVLHMQKDILASRIKASLIIVFCIYLIFSAIIILFAPALLNFMLIDNQEAISYIRLESIAFIFLILSQVNGIIFTLLNKEKYILILLLLQTFLTTLLDIFFLSSFSISLNLGVLGIAYSNIISFSFITLLGLYLINRTRNILHCKIDLSWLKEWFKIGSISGLESLVRNLAYFYMIIYMMNVLSEQGVYWQATSFIWAWLLLPALKLGELIKRDTGESIQLFHKNYKAYLAIISVIVCIWLLLAPFYSSLLKTLLNIQEPQKIIQLLVILVPFYIFFAYSQIWNSYLYGIGKTDYILYASLFVNTIYYGGNYLAYKQAIFIPTLESIAYMFGCGLVLNTIINYMQYRLLSKKKEIYGNNYAIN